MIFKLPKIKTKYHFKLIRESTGELVQECITHNEMTSIFWNSGNEYGTKYPGIILCSSTEKQDKTDNTLKDPLFEVGFTKCGSKESNTLWFNYEVPASATYVGTIASFGITWHMNQYPSYPSYLAKCICATRGQLTDSEGSSITINKTALDKLIIEVEWQLMFNDGDFTWFKENDNCMIQSNKMHNYDYKGNKFMTSLANPIYVSTLPGTKGIVSPRIHCNSISEHNEYYPYLQWAYTLTTSWKKEQLPTDKYNSKPTETGTIRLAQELLPERYINSIGIVGLGCINLPNTSVFPIYTLQNIEVGTGDGTTTDFECPIPWYLKDTDKLYKNGSLLTRDVDYTIDYKHNRQKCLSISEGNFAEIISGYTEYIGSPAGNPYQTVNIWGCNFLPFSACIDAKANYGAFYIPDRFKVLKLNNNVPLVLDMHEEKEINYFISPYITGNYSDKLVLSYSNDAKTYTKVGEVDVLKTKISAGSAIPENYTLSFSTIKARYWKIDITSTSGENNIYEFARVTDTQSSTLKESMSPSYNQCGFLGYVGEPIKFKTPPAKGDIITMDVSLDRPYKTTQNVIDIAFKYNY